MQIIENLKVKEKLYVEKLENGLKIMIMPKPDMQKKYIIWGTNFGSIDNTFILPGEKEPTKVPDGIAHFLEHKMFEQKEGTNSLDTLSNIGVEANAYTTNDHTAYLYEATDNFYEALDEFMDYVQNPYYTDENVEKEKGIIAQEIKMYDDNAEWEAYSNALKNMYGSHPIAIKISGSVESISKIDKETLYKCYNNFYNPANMTMVVCGDFEPEKLLEEIKKRLIEKENIGETQRIYPKIEKGVNKKETQVEMEVSQPVFDIAFKDPVYSEESSLADLEQNRVKRHIAIEIILYLLLGRSSNLYKQLYEKGILLNQPDLSYEFSKHYGYVMITGQSKEPKKIAEGLEKEIKRLKENGISQDDFFRVRKKTYGDFVTEYNNLESIATMFLGDDFKGINCFDYIEECNLLTKEYTEQVLEEVFEEENMTISIVNPKKTRN